MSWLLTGPQSASQTVSPNTFISCVAYASDFYPSNWKVQPRASQHSYSLSPRPHFPSGVACSIRWQRGLWKTCMGSLAYSHTAQIAEKQLWLSKWKYLYASFSLNYHTRVTAAISKKWCAEWRKEWTTHNIGSGTKEVSSKSSAVAFLTHSFHYMTHSIHTLWSEDMKQLAHWEAWEAAAKLVSLGQRRYTAHVMRSPIASALNPSSNLHSGISESEFRQDTM